MKNVFLMLLCLVLVGCASFNVDRMDNVGVYPPCNPSSVRIFTQEPSIPYIVIAEIRAQGETLSRREHMEQRLREKAAEIGADAVILQTKVEVRGIRKAGVAVEEDQGYGLDINSMFTKKMAGKVIKFKK